MIKRIKEKTLDNFFVERGIDIPRNKATAREKAIEILLKEVRNV